MFCLMLITQFVAALFGSTFRTSGEDVGEACSDRSCCLPVECACCVTPVSLPHSSPVPNPSGVPSPTSSAKEFPSQPPSECLVGGTPRDEVSDGLALPARSVGKPDRLYSRYCVLLL